MACGRGSSGSSERCRLVLLAGEEVRQGLGFAGRRVGLRLDLGQTQRLRQPARAVEQPLGLLGHFGLLQVVDELRRLFALGLAHGFEDASLWNPAEIVVGGGPPAGRGHVEVDGPGELVAMGERARTTVPRLLHDIDGERGAVREERRLAVAVECRQRIPKIRGRFGQLLGPLIVPRIDRLGRRRSPPGRAPGRRSPNSSP